jgi:hypothetical protein
MEAPLEFNEGLRKASAEGKLDNNPKFKAAVDAAPIKMISTAMPGVDPMTGMIQQNQFAPSPVNPRALGGLQNQIPNIVGAAVPGMYDRVLPSPLANNHDDKKLVGENTDEIKKDKKGREYSLVMEDSKNFRKGDTIRPANNKTFRKSITTDGYIMGGDYKVDKRNRIINK